MSIDKVLMMIIMKSMIVVVLSLIRGASTFVSSPLMLLFWHQEKYWASKKFVAVVCEGVLGVTHDDKQCKTSTCLQHIALFKCALIDELIDQFKAPHITGMFC